MIFRKLLCGGFGILMSHNDQVEQIFHFTVLPKWWVGFSTAQSCMDWTLKNPQRLPSSFNIAKYHQNTPRLSLRHPKTSPNSIRHYRHHRISSKTFKVVYLVHHIWGAEWRWSHPTILAHQWNATFFPSDNFETSKYQNRRIKAF